MKKWIIRLVIAGVVLVVIALAVVFFSLNTIVKRGVEYVGPQIVKVDVKLGSAAISPFSGSGQLSNLELGNPPGYSSPHSIKIGDIKVAVVTSSLRSDTIKVDSINIQGPEVICEGGLLSGINLREIQKNLASGEKSGGGTTDGKTTADSGKKFYVKDIVVEGGKITMALKELGGKGVTLPLPPIHLRNVGSETMGVTARELTQQILEPVLAAALKAVIENAGNLGGGVGEIGKGATEQINKVGKELKGIFGK